MIIFNPSQVPAADGEYYAVIRVKSLNARATEVTAEHSAEIDTACTNAVGSDGQGALEKIPIVSLQNENDAPCGW